MFSSLCWPSLLFLFALFRFSVLFLFRCFLFSFSFFASFSSFLFFFLGLSFICFVLSSFFGFSFPPSSPPSSLPHSPFRSRFGFFFSLLWPLFLGFLLLPFLLFLFCPLPSSLFIFRLRFFPSTLFFPSCWLFFLLVCPRCLFGGFLFFLFAFLAFGLRFLSVCVFGLFWSSLCFSCWCFRSRGSPFVPGSLSLSSSLVGSFLCLCFCLFLGSSLSSVFCASSFYYSSTWFLPVASAAVPLSPAPSSLASLYFTYSSVLRLPLFGSAEGGVAPAQRLRYLDIRRWSLLLIRGFSPWFLLPLLCTSCCRFWLFFSASDCFSVCSPFLFSGFAALGWGSAPAVLHGLVLSQVPRPSCLPFFFASGPPLLSCALSESSRLCCFCLSSWSLGCSVLCF